MIKQFQYYYSKHDFFKYIFLSITIFIYMRNSRLINYDNIISITSSFAIMFIIISLHNNYQDNHNEKVANIYNSFNYSKYPNIKTDDSIILILNEIKDLKDVNSIEFRNLLRSIDEFIFQKKYIYTSNSFKDSIFDGLKEKGANILNILHSFSVNLDYSSKRIDDIQINPENIVTNIRKYPESIKKMRLWVSKHLTEVEVYINEKWLLKDIDIFSKPIYPDDIEANKYNSNYYNVY